MGAPPPPPPQHLLQVPLHPPHVPLRTDRRRRRPRSRRPLPPLHLPRRRDGGRRSVPLPRRLRFLQGEGAQPGLQPQEERTAEGADTSGRGVGGQTLLDEARRAPERRQGQGQGQDGGGSAGFEEAGLGAGERGEDQRAVRDQGRPVEGKSLHLRQVQVHQDHQHPEADQERRRAHDRIRTLLELRQSLEVLRGDSDRGR
mmetsp:Transcript_28593/g.58542  ORF Transcript_28593/g.58542 Transcript_28593/m.58542 type:complete len:200 (+) Transcript_28593:147-746(+)